VLRDAHFPAPGIRRRLSCSWGPGPRAFVLGCNPSDANAERDDPTSKWWNRWFQHWGFGAYDAGNLYSFVTSSPAACRARAQAALAGQDWYDRDEMFANLADVVAMAKQADRVFVCFGAIAWDHDWVDHVIEAIQSGEGPWPDLWCWGTTKAGAPTHPLARGKHRIDPLTAPVLWKAANA